MIIIKRGLQKYIAKNKNNSNKWQVYDNSLCSIIVLTPKTYTEEVEDTDPQRKYEIMSALFNTSNGNLEAFIEECF